MRSTVPREKLDDISRGAKKSTRNLRYKVGSALIDRARNNDGRTEIPLHDTGHVHVGVGGWRIGLTADKRWREKPMLKVPAGGERSRSVNKLLADIVSRARARARVGTVPNFNCSVSYSFPPSHHCPFPGPAIRRLVFCAANSSRAVYVAGAAGAPLRHSTLVLPRGGGTGVSRLVPFSAIRLNGD